MPLDPTKVALAMANGLGAVCATCTKYWEAQERGAPRCLAKTHCGSPIAGDVFHEYAGPMTQFDRFCFVCGSEATHALRVSTHIRVIGCCKEHVGLVKELRPESAPAVNVVVASKDGSKSSEEMAKEKQSSILRIRSS